MSAEMETPDGEFIGQMLGTTVTREDLQRFFNASSITVVYPGRQYTRDYIAQRLRVIVDDNHIIEEITWG